MKPCFRPLHVDRFFNSPKYFNDFNPILGFGLDPVTNKHKVVWIHSFWDESMHYPSSDPSLISVYTVEDDSWRHLEPCFVGSHGRVIRNSSLTTCLNGVYYWLSEDVNMNYKIVSFDMSSYVFRETPGPDNPTNRRGDLLLHNGSVVLFLCDPLEIVGGVDIWVMKEEGCWTKHFTFGPPQVQGVLGFWKNDELFLETLSSQLVLYNTSTHEIRALGIQGNFGQHNLWVFKHKESLVSVKRGNDDLEVDDLYDTIHFFKFPRFFDWQQ